MQVPVLLIRHVLVKVVPPAILVLSGIVTSATKEALLVQSAAFAGCSVPTVAVTVNGVAEVAVAEVSGEAGIAVSALGSASVMETSVVATVPSVAVTVAVSAVACPPQAD